MPNPDEVGRRHADARTAWRRFAWPCQHSNHVHRSTREVFQNVLGGLMMGGTGLTRRRGSAYIGLIGVAMIVTVIGLSALLGVRVELRTARLTEASAASQFVAPSIIEVGLLRINEDPDWRRTYTHDVWGIEETIGALKYTLKLVDEQDGDLANDPTDLARLYAKTTVGDAVGIYSVLLKPGPVLDRRIAADIDDAEQRSGDGYVYMDSSDLELAVDSAFANTDIVGMRFTNVALPQGSTIQKAFVQFKADKTSDGAAALNIAGEDVNDALQFTTSDWNISGRTTTSASVAWSPPKWDTVGATGVDQRTPDISSIIQEIVDRSGWSIGNALVIIISGTGTRTAESYDGDADGAPLLHVEWDASLTVTPVSGTWRREVAP